MTILLYGSVLPNFFENGSGVKGLNNSKSVFTGSGVKVSFTQNHGL